MRIAPAIQQILTAHGMVDIESVANSHAISRRHLEREFRKIVGLTPKYFARIIQFKYIFEAMQRKDNAWVDVALNSGYFDQSHFIRNFREFTGESPAQYGFDQKNLANFFLHK
jgi:methylphosphotriester-DNA--protein-cysteine methyltransferase